MTKKKVGRPKKVLKRITVTEARQIEKARSAHAIAVDFGKKARRKPKSISEWAAHPDRYDYPGIDAAKSTTRKKTTVRKKSTTKNPWQSFLKRNMKSYMKKYGTHAKAMKALGKAYKKK